MVRYNIKLLSVNPLSNGDDLQDLVGSVIAAYDYEAPVHAQEVADLWAEESDLFAKIVQAWSDADYAAEQAGDTVEWVMFTPSEEPLEIGDVDTADMDRDGHLAGGGQTSQTELVIEICAVDPDEDSEEEEEEEKKKKKSRTPMSPPMIGTA